MQGQIKRHSHRRRRLLAAGLWLIILVGCQRQGPDANYSDYLDRLGRTLSVEVPLIEYAPLPRLPRPGQLRLEISSTSVDTLDFLALRGCAVQATIGKRNSSLGRLARDSQRLLLELEYLQLAPQCVADLRARDQTTLANTLQQAWLAKQQQLPALIFNATLGGAEYRALWQVPPAPGDYPRGISSQVISALEAINIHTRRWLSGDYTADNRAFEILLSEIAAGDGGALWQALAHQGSWLAAADLMLGQRMAQGPLCSTGIRPAAADILPNVVRKVFIGKIQPRAAALGRRRHELVPAIAVLEDLLASVLAPDYSAWQGKRQLQLSKLATAPQQHVGQLKRILAPCVDP